MKNLEMIPGLQEMNTQEVKDINGGSILAVLVIAVAALAIDLIADGKIDGKI